MHVHIVLCYGAKRVLFTNKLSECWCCIINPYLFIYKFHTSKHLGKGLHNVCSHCSLLWCEKGIVYQQVIRMLVSYHHYPYTPSTIVLRDTQDASAQSKHSYTEKIAALEAQCGGC